MEFVQSLLGFLLVFSALNTTLMLWVFRVPQK